MTAGSRNPEGNDRLSTYMVNNRGEEELSRLRVQDRMLTASMGGVLSEQVDPTTFRRVLDIGCGSGSWVVQAAQRYPHMSLVGIDISKRMIDYAQILGEQEQVADRVKFQVMDALLMLEFGDESFDLVNIRLGLSFMRTWDWPKMLKEMGRVTRSGGVIRVTDTEVVHESNSPKLTQLQEIATRAFFRAGHLFEETSDGFFEHMPRLLEQYVGPQVQTLEHKLVYAAGTPECNDFIHDMSHIYQTLRPFLKKWGCEIEGYDELYAQAVGEMQRPDFHAMWRMVTSWVVVPAVR